MLELGDSGYWEQYGSTHCPAAWLGLLEHTRTKRLGSCVKGLDAKEVFSAVPRVLNGIRGEKKCMAGAENKLKKSKGICMVAAELPPVLLLVLLPSHCRLLPLSPARWGTPCMESCHPGTVVPYWGSAGRGGHLVSVHANIAGAARCVPQHVSANGTEQGRARRWGQGEALRAPNNNNDRCRCWRFYHSKPLEWLSIGTLCLFREILTAVTFLNCHIPFNYDWHLMEMWARDWQPKQLSSFPQFFRFLPINRHNVGYFSGINSNLCPPPLFGKRSTLHSFQKAPWNAAEKGLSSSALLLLSSSSPPPPPPLLLRAPHHPAPAGDFCARANKGSLATLLDFISKYICHSGIK